MAREIEAAGHVRHIENAGIDAINTGNHVDDVVVDFSWLNSMEEKLTSTYGKPFAPFTICRVQTNIRKGDPAAYSPMIVSIGPFHRGRNKLRAMEGHKWHYLHEVLARSKGNNLDKFLKEMKAVEKEARECYSGNIDMSSNEFVEMMILDGCFIIQILHQQRNYVTMNDPIYRNISALNRIGCDMLLLENQLPFFVLERLWELSSSKQEASSSLRKPPSLREAALAFFNDVLTDELENKHLKAPDDKLENKHLKAPDDKLEIKHLKAPDDKLENKHLKAPDDKLENKHPKAPDKKLRNKHAIDHLLHLVHLSLKPAASPTTKSRCMSGIAKLSSLQLCQYIWKIIPPLRPRCLVDTHGGSPTPGQHSSQEPKDEAPTLWKMIPSATELQEAGVEFKRKKSASSFFDLTFEHGLMEMPRLWISDSTNTLLRNFIAFEQCFPERGNDFTSYCIFIDFLVNTPRDVSILRHSDIIRHGLGSNEEVALLFNNICKGIVWYSEYSYLANTLEDVIQYTKNDIPKWRSKLVRDYCSSPCATLSLIAAITILIFAFVQTYFTVFAYFRPPKS